MLRSLAHRNVYAKSNSFCRPFTYARLQKAVKQESGVFLWILRIFPSETCSSKSFFDPTRSQCHVDFPQEMQCCNWPMKLIWATLSLLLIAAHRIYCNGRGISLFLPIFLYFNSKMYKLNSRHGECDQSSLLLLLLLLRVIMMAFVRRQIKLLLLCGTVRPPNQCTTIIWVFLTDNVGKSPLSFSFQDFCVTHRWIWQIKRDWNLFGN